MTTSNLIETPTLQQRFIAFCAEAKEAGVKLSPVEMKAWYAYYKAANPETLEIRLGVSKAAKQTGNDTQGFIAAVDSLTRLGILELLKHGNQRVMGGCAVRRLVLSVARMKELQNLPLEKTLPELEMKIVQLFKANGDGDGKWAVAVKHLASLLKIEDVKEVSTALFWLNKKEIMKTVEKPAGKPAVRQLLRR